MNTEATYHDDKDTVFDIKTDAQKQENAENLIKTHEKPDPDMGNEGDNRLGPAALLASGGLGPTDYREGYCEG